MEKTALKEILLYTFIGAVFLIGVNTLYFSLQKTPEEKIDPFTTWRLETEKQVQKKIRKNKIFHPITIRFRSEKPDHQYSIIIRDQQTAKQGFRLLQILDESKIFSLKKDSQKTQVPTVFVSSDKKSFEASFSASKIEESIEMLLFLKLLQLYSGENPLKVAQEKLTNENSR